MIRLTGVVVSKNEGHLLENCIRSILFCQEIIVVDLESTDSTIEIAESLGVKVISHKPVTHVELIHSNIREISNNKWILIIDPDEEISQSLQEELKKLLSSVTEKIGAIRVPIQYYFKNRPLRGTKWGIKDHSRVLIVNMDGYIFSSLVHEGRKVKSEYQEISILLNQTHDNLLYHFWMTDYTQLIKKHVRYIHVEGESMYKNGLKYTGLRQIKYTLYAFKYSFFTTQGYKDGLTGLFLSIFWSWYTFMKWNSLKSYQAVRQNNIGD
jgi:glycosyltransferase involved in cell wall biosynthesis